MSSPAIDLLISDHFEGLLDEPGRQRLEAWLAADAANRRRFLRLAMDHAALPRLTAVHAALPVTRRTRRIVSVRRRRWPLPLALAAGLLLALGGWWLLAAPPAADRQPLLVGAGRLPAGAAVAADDAPAVLRWDDGSEVRLAPGTRAEVAEGVALRLLAGRFYASIAVQPAAQPARFRTAEAEITVLGTELAVAAAAGESAAEVAHGRVRVRRMDGAEVTVAGGECVAIVPGLPLRARPLGTPAGTVHAVAPGADWPALQPGDVLDLAAGTHTGAWRLAASGTVLRPILVRGAGPLATVLDATGMRTDGQGGPRAALQLEGRHVVVADLALRGARNRQNAAGVRLLSAADGIVLRRCRIADCDLGVDADPGGGSLLVEDCELLGNGVHDGDRAAYNLKLGNRAATVRGCRLADAAFGANILLHAGQHRLEANRLSGGGQGEIGVELGDGEEARVELVGNLVAGRARAAGSNRSRFIYVNRAPTAVASLRVHACTLVAGEDRQCLLDAPGCRVELSASILAGTGRIASSGTRLEGRRNCLPPGRAVEGLTETLLADPRFADPPGGDFQLRADSPCRDAALAPPPALAPPGPTGAATPRTAGRLGAY